MKKKIIVLTFLGISAHVWFAEATPPKPGSAARAFRTVHFFIPERMIFRGSVHKPQPTPIQLKNAQGALVALGALGGTKVLEKCGVPSEMGPFVTILLSIAGYSLCPNKQQAGRDINQAILIFSGYETLKNGINYFWKNEPQEKPFQPGL